MTISDALHRAFTGCDVNAEPSPAPFERQPQERKSECLMSSADAWAITFATH